MARIGRIPLLRSYMLIMVILVLVLCPLIVTSSYVLHLLIAIFMYATLSESWNLVWGYTGLPSFGHIAFFGIGAYTMGVLLVKGYVASPYVAILFGGAMAAIVAIAIGIPCLRIKGVFFAVTTLGINGAARLIVSNWTEVTGGGTGITLHKFIPEAYSKTPFYYLSLVIMLATISITYIIVKSKFGIGLVAIREDEDAAEAMGVPAGRHKTIAFAISCFFTGMAGGSYTYYMFFIDPTTVFDMGISILCILMAIAGGSGTILGPIFGSALLVLLSEFLRNILIFSHAIIYGALLVVIVLFIPSGIIGWLRNRLPPSSKLRSLLI